MSGKMGGALALVSLCAFSLLLLNCGSSSSRPAGLLYVISQAQFNVSSFSMDLNNGNISLINSNATTCTSSPQNCGLAVSMLLDPTKTVAFVLNQGSAAAGVAPTIYGYTVGSDGSLSAPTTAATLPVGDTSVSMTADAAGDTLFVIDQGSNPVATDCPGGSDCPSILVFSTKPGSTTVTPASVFSLDRIPTAFSVITFTPPAPNNNQQTLLLMTSNKDLTAAHDDNELSVYSVVSGNLTEETNSPYTTLPDPEAVLAVNTNLPPATTGGVFVYVGNQGSVSGSVSAFQVCTEVGSQGNGTCTASGVQNDQLLPVGTPSGAGQNPIAMLVDPTSSFLYVLSYGSSQIFAFRIATGTGTLSPLAPASAPTGAQPVAMAMHGNFTASGEFIYTSNSTGESITGFTVGATTGSLNTNPTTTLFTPGLPGAMAAK